MDTADVRVVEMGDQPDDSVLDMLADLVDAEQDHYDHPRETRDAIRGRLNPAPRFTGENHLLLARDGDGAAVGVCWVVLFDPGTGLEGEVAELYVRPDARGDGIARRLVVDAVELFRRRGVTFASVWTRGDNAAALAAYGAAGFAPTDQKVLTWLPLQ